MPCWCPNGPTSHRSRTPARGFWRPTASCASAAARRASTCAWWRPRRRCGWITAASPCRPTPCSRRWARSTCASCRRSRAIRSRRCRRTAH
ncbi:Uncharacterised protein [Bordetella pertussis]|nr:Uncharacterised protein [Bordetella pertussis]